jgi:excisionase family DNA binding protein
MERRWLTVGQVSRMLGISAMTVYRRIDSGELAAVKIGGLYRISESDLEAYLDRSRTS